MSMVPPRPTPSTIGGQGFEPARETVSTTACDDARPALSRLEHGERRHVLGAAALGHHGDLDLVAGHDGGVHDAGVLSVVLARAWAGWAAIDLRKKPSA